MVHLDKGCHTVMKIIVLEAYLMTWENALHYILSEKNQDAKLNLHYDASLTKSSVCLFI